MRAAREKKTALSKKVARAAKAAGEATADSKAIGAMAVGFDMLAMDRLPIGVPAQVAGLEASGGLRRRLIELGFFEGERVEKVLKSPLGDPSAYLVRGTVTAIRDADAAKVLVQAEGAARSADVVTANGGGAAQSDEPSTTNECGAARSAESIEASGGGCGEVV
ncbi:MAG: ferrous iron transport protein A [Clostridia bacterium]|nr:ferrous iron transport protein A [Clostridia bacterium]